MDSKEIKEMNLFKNLKKYFDTTSKEQQDKDWKEVEPLNNIGSDVIDYIGYQLLQHKIDKQNLDKLKKDKHFIRY